MSQNDAIFFVFPSNFALEREGFVSALKHRCNFFFMKNFYVTLQLLSGSIDMGSFPCRELFPIYTLIRQLNEIYY